MEDAHSPGKGEVKAVECASCHRPMLRTKRLARPERWLWECGGRNGCLSWVSVRDDGSVYAAFWTSDLFG